MSNSKFRYTGKDQAFGRKFYADGGVTSSDIATTSKTGSLTGINSDVSKQVAGNADWNKYENAARPSTNVEDHRDRGWSKYIPSLGDVAAQTGGLGEPN